MDKYRLSLMIIGVLAVAILFGGWFVGVQPQLDRIARATEQTVSVKQMNDVQQLRNDALAADNDHLEDYKRELAAMQKQIPATRSQQELINQIDAAAKAADVTIRTLTFDSAISFTAPEGVTTGLPSGGTFVAVPLSLAATGARADLEKFAANLQKSARIITIGSSQFTGAEDGSLVLGGVTWVLMPAA